MEIHAEAFMLENHENKKTKRMLKRTTKSAEKQKTIRNLPKWYQRPAEHQQINQNLSTSLYLWGRNDDGETSALSLFLLLLRLLFFLFFFFLSFFFRFWSFPFVFAVISFLIIVISMQHCRGISSTLWYFIRCCSTNHRILTAALQLSLQAFLYGGVSL